MAETQASGQPQVVQWTGPDPEEPQKSELDIEREKHARRAAKFGTAFVEPTSQSEPGKEGRRERLQRPGFVTGIDLFCPVRGKEGVESGVPGSVSVTGWPQEVGPEPRSEVQSRHAAVSAGGIAGPCLCCLAKIDDALSSPVTQEEVAKREARAAKFGVNADTLRWEPAEDMAQRAARAVRFGTQFAPAQDAMMDVDLLETRHEPSLSHALRPDAVYVYGVDLMSTGEVLRMFVDYGPRFVEWINDSSCVVLFADAAGAKRAVAGLGRPLPPDPGSELQGLDPADPGNMEYMWHQVGGRGPEDPATQTPMLLRIATTEDVRAQGKVQSRRLWLDKPQRRGGHAKRGGHGGRGGRPRVVENEHGMEDEEQADPDSTSGGGGLGVRRQGKQRRARPHAPGGDGANALFKRALGQAVAEAGAMAPNQSDTRPAVNYADL